MATADDSSPLRDLRTKLTALDNAYEVCSTLFKQVNEILENDELDELTIAILQQYKLGNQETPFRKQVNDKWKQLKRTRSELRLAVCGDVAAGKSSFVNFLMGGDFLPSVQGSCTQVVCEICHAEKRSVEISYIDVNNQTQVQTEILERNPGSTNWVWLRNVIEEGYILCDETQEQMAVRNVRIYWPLEIFQETEAKTIYSRQDIDETKVKTVYNRQDIDDQHINVVFCDFPGLDNSPNVDGTFPSFRPIQDAVEKNDVDGFLFVINNSAFHGVTSTVKTLMAIMAKNLNGTKFDTELTMFICNKWDEVDQREHKQLKLKQTILENLLTEWPNVQETQIITFSCTKKTNEHLLTTQLYKYIENVKWRKIEEHWLWLVDLCEAANGLLLYKKRWCKAEQAIGEIRQKAVKDIEFLQQAKQDLDKQGRKEINSKLSKHKESFKSHMLNRLQKYCDSRDFKQHETQFTVDLNITLNDYRHEFKKFEEDINDWRDQQRDNILKKSWLLHLFQNTPSERSFKYDSLIYVPMILLFPVVFPFIPLVKIYLVGRTIVDDLQEAFFSNAKQRIQREVNRLDEYVETVVQDLIERINRQIDILYKIDGEIASSENTLNQLSKITNSLLTVFITDIARHEINLDDVDVREVIGQGVHTVHGVMYRGERMARKKIETRITIRPTDDAHDAFRTTDSISTQVLFCRELLLLRKLSGLHTDPDFKHIVGFKGSAIETDCQFYTLYLFMEIGESNLLGYWGQVGPTLTSKKRIDIMIGAARGLRLLHNNNIIHRDIKPSNFLIKDGIVKLCDFDHSKDDEKIVTAGQARGTPRFHPPEISEFNHLHTEKSDIYSFGLVLQYLWNENRGPPNSFQRREQPIKNLVLHCMQEQPHRRPDIGIVIESLKTIMDS